MSDESSETAPVIAPELATPDEHAEATGNILQLKPRRVINGKFTISATPTAAHMAAAQLHGWVSHQAATVTPFTLTREDYVAALTAAQEGAAPHAPAVSPFAPNYDPVSAREPVAAARKARR